MARGPKSDVISPIGLIEENLGEPLPADEAQASAHPVPAGGLHWAVAAGFAAAAAAFELARGEGHRLLQGIREDYRRLRATAVSARRMLGVHEGEYEQLVASRALVQRLLGGRLRRTRFTFHKALWLTVGVVIGEVSLNSSAAVAAGDPVVLSVVSFVGIGAATVGIGLLGVVLRHAVDQLRYEQEAPQEALEAGLGHFYHPAGRLKAVGLGLGAVVVVSMAALGLGVAALRVAGQSSPLFGLFTALTMVGAAAIAFWAEDPVADLLLKTDERIDKLGVTMAAERTLVAAAEGARAKVKETKRTSAAEARAHYSLALSAILFALSRQPHAVGTYGPGAMVPLTYEEYCAGTWRAHPGVLDLGESGDESSAPAGAYPLSDVDLPPKSATASPNGNMPHDDGA